VVNRRAALANASMQAQRLHAQLNTDYNHPVDIFSVIQELRVWLSSRPLGAGLFGFYLREGDASGIVVNSSHPEYLQRYTAAHELGHHILGHRSHLDDRDDIIGDSPADRHDEHAAQMFAGNFLMPIQAVNRVQRRLEIPRDRDPSPGQVYALSRELDVSFSAAAWQLVNLGRLSSRRAAEIVRSGAADAKRALRPGPHPEGDNRAGLVLIDESGRDVPVLVRPGDELRIRVLENGSTGYVWQLSTSDTNLSSAAEDPGFSWDGATNIDVRSGGASGSSPSAEQPSPVVLVGDRYFDMAGSPSGAPDAKVPAALGTAIGRREFVFLADHPGRHEVSLILRRPWQDTEPLNVLTTQVRVGPTHAIDGLSENQGRSHVARVAAGAAR
jgi:Zn-dependent peptidase ImmA (M78 family)